MKKSLKKVISAIAALALSTSSFVAFAANFPDVAATADYAKAVDQLTGMGIVEGRDDGTFDPDATVTRAEMTTMVIRALGSEAAATSMAGRDTVFRDVDHNHWAAGYVAVANTISPQFVQGMGDGTFAPDATVTYAQAVTMLVRALGYESMAAPSGYPNGYLGQAGAIGMLSGFSIPASNDTELNRGQVAILIDNAVVNCPILGEGTWQQGILGGSYAPEIKDGVIPGQGNFWKSLATTKHNVYQVFGRVTGTKQTGFSNDADEVQVTIMRSKNFDGFSYGFGYDSASATRTPRVNVGTTDAASNLNQYAEFLIEDTNDDEYVILAYTLTDGRTQSDTFDAKRYDDYNAANHTISFLDENGSNSRDYRLNTNGVNWYINGYPVGSMNDTDIDTYLADNNVGDVTLNDYISADGSQGADGRYDEIMITYYRDAVVDEVATTPAGITNITFVAAAFSDGALKIDPDDDDRVVTFKGDATSAEELEQYDILSIQSEPGKNLANSSNVTVTVSKKEATGTVSRTKKDDIDTDANRYVLSSGDEYTINKDLEGDMDEIENSGEYTFKLDAFDYISYVVEGENAKNYGIIDGMFTSDGGATYRVRLIEGNGEVNVYDYYKQESGAFIQAANDYAYTGYTLSAAGAVTGGDLRPVQDRVVTYTVLSNGTLRITGSADPTEGNATYQMSSNRVGSVRMNDNTQALDLVDYANDGGSGDVEVMGSFQADSLYHVFGYGKSNADSTFKFVIVTEGVGGISMDSPLAVVTSRSDADYGDGPVVQFTVLTNGEETDLIYDDTVAAASSVGDASDLDYGDAFVYELGADNKIKDLMTVYDMQDTTYGVDAYGEFVNNAFAEATDAIGAQHAEGSTFDVLLEGDVPTADTFDDQDENGKDVYSNFNKGRGDYAFFTFGPVLSTTGGVTIGSLENYDNKVVSFMDVDTDYSFDASFNVYTIDWNVKSSNGDKISLGSRSSVQRTALSNSILTEVTTKGDPYEGNEYIDWAGKLGVGNATIDTSTTNNQTAVSFALLKIYGGSITEGYSIIAPR